MFPDPSCPWISNTFCSKNQSNRLKGRFEMCSHTETLERPFLLWMSLLDDEHECNLKIPATNFVIDDKYT